MAERLKAAVLKTVECNSSVGSNPIPSATFKEMNMILDKINTDLAKAMLERNEEVKDALRLVKGEIPRLNLKVGVVPTDEQILKIISKMIKSEKTVLEYRGETKSPFIEILEKYLPQMMSEDDIVIWIDENIVINDFNPKIKAMGKIMKSLKGKADGNLVRKILSGK